MPDDILYVGLKRKSLLKRRREKLKHDGVKHQVHEEVSNLCKESNHKNVLGIVCTRCNPEFLRV